MKGYRLAGFFVVCALIAIPLRGETTQQPKELITGVVNNVLTVLKDPSLKGPDKQQQRRIKIQEVMEERFDFIEMSQRTLALHWQKRTEAEKKEFTSLFKNLLEGAYISKIEKYSDEQVNVIEEKTDDGFSTVKTEVITQKAKIPIDYRLKSVSDDKGWKVYDVVIEGVSLVNNYRSQFQSIINTKGYDALTKMLKEKKNE
ncbi:MAG: ABC transporter substrate-binding protein [Nitrospirae bacterium]|uniref:MlaC/ttg2D family ABC transporter substrate-binding protein n=1 Tax=Candidatus Magnetobacterium casense TaxID=1455061 RepID=UPI00058FA033|nr:ABC transporter substrate-binding protein [Candidatus Magnetobacterium casensis]MBF0337933.1 ABC transporter substrate-binding protein [Nitrospirota bacterium]